MTQNNYIVNQFLGNIHESLQKLITISSAIIPINQVFLHTPGNPTKPYISITELTIKNNQNFSNENIEGIFSVVLHLENYNTEKIFLTIDNIIDLVIRDRFISVDPNINVSVKNQGYKVNTNEIKLDFLVNFYV